MSKEPAFDLRAAHRYFSADCFNKAWDLIDKVQRTPDEDEEMLRLSYASLWHWTRRDDCKRANLSIAYWQLARIHALIGRAEETRSYARVCLEHSKGESPFLLAYAYEALARAEKMAGRAAESAKYLAEAERFAAEVTEQDDRALVLKDLAALKG